MGLLITKKDRPILVSGTEIELPSVYCRIYFLGKDDGKTMEIVPTIFTTDKTYEEKKPCPTDIPLGNFLVTVDPDEIQSSETALKYAVKGFEQLGYNAEIV